MDNLPIWNIINISDPYTIIGEYDVVVVAALILGKGHFGLEEVNGERELPSFLFLDPDEWFQKTFSCSLEDLYHDVTKNRKQELINTLDSVLIGSDQSRQFFNSTLHLMTEEDKKLEWKISFHDEHRSSLNDIGRKAWSVAERLRSA